jgi:acyl carrier protein
MTFDSDAARLRIRARIAELARELGRDASHLGDDDVIPQSGMLDSAGILGLIVWSEGEFDVILELEEISLDNFGTVNRMVEHLRQLKVG